MNRRDFISATGLSGLGILSFPGFKLEVKKKNPVILIVSGWQDVNIGDIAHTPGLLHLFETYMPEAKIILWKRSRGEQVKKLINSNFPRVKVIYGDVNSEKNTDSQDVLDSFNQADLMVHGSGPSLVGADNLACWAKATGKPYGVFGATLQDPNKYHVDLLKKASFIFTRETKSLAHLIRAGIEGPHVVFAPDATFWLDLKDKKKADRFLSSNDLVEKKFICVIPRLRYTPYHLFNPNRNGWSDERIKMVEETNLKFKEQDHAKMREAMISWVRNTRNKIVVCPEMTYQVDIMDELLIDPLPADVKPMVVKHPYWLPDEAASLYAKAFAVLSFECHSPIIAAVNGTPLFYLRQPEDTIKGQMYYDLGFENYVFEIDNTSGKHISDRLLEVHGDYSKAKEDLKRSMNTVRNRYDEGFRIVEGIIRI